MGRYISFLANADPDDPWTMNLYEADGAFVETLGTGHTLTAGTDSLGDSYFFFVGNDGNTGQLFSGSLGMNSTAGMTFTGTLNPTLVQLDTFSIGLSTNPLAAGEFVAGEPVAEELVALSILERVLAQIDGATNIAKLNGTFVNIAENAGSTGGGIDGSISNTVMGVNAATQSAIVGAIASATEWTMPTITLGNMSTTVLGAVNTGEITLGVNQSIDEASTKSTAAYSAAVSQLGGASNAGVLVLNLASNMTGVSGAITNSLSLVNGAVGNMNTTALGAVNTGSITSGVGGTVMGIVNIGGLDG